MKMLTDKEIQQDIQEFQDRISAARGKLAGLPDGRLPFPEHKKREKQRRELEDDIRHFQKIITYAREGLDNCEKRG